MKSKFMLKIVAITIFTHSISLAREYKFHLSSAWYPPFAKLLRKKIDELRLQAQQKFSTQLLPEHIKAVIVPHASYDYSGVVAGSVYAALQSTKFERVIVLAPSHYAAFVGVGLPDLTSQGYRTPLDIMPFDQTFMHDLVKKSDLFAPQDAAYEIEHAVEVQIPFLQTFCSGCTLVPLLVGQVTHEQIKKIADVLCEGMDEKSLLVVSSDFTHFGKSFDYTPFSHHVLQNIFALDGKLVRAIQNLNVSEFDQVVRETQATVCGKSAISIALHCLRKKYGKDIAGHVIGYAISAKDEQEPAHCVSYVGLGFSTQKKSQIPLEQQLTPYEQQFLLQLARTRLQQVVIEQKDASADLYLPGLVTKALHEKSGAFVTLYQGKDRQLRGCIGSLLAEKPLYQTVWNMTASSALRDSRFSPVQPLQLDDVSIAISVLTHPQKINSIHEIRLGIDGVILQQGMHQAVYLPKVAVEQGWNLEQMLSSLSQKAGLKADAFKDARTEFKIFQSIDFFESKKA